MRAFAPAVMNHLKARSSVDVRFLIWVSARNRSTGAITPVGIWSGEYDRSFSIGGAARLYKGGLGTFAPPAIHYGVGLDVRMLRIPFASIAPEWETVFRDLDARLARVELHRVFFNPQTGLALGAPDRLFKGRVDEMPISRPALGQEAQGELVIASTARMLTRSVPVLKSDASQRQRGGDRFARYADVSGSVTIKWGTE